MNKLQVLVFLDWYAPGFKAGGPVRSMVNLVDHLRDQVSFNIVTTNTDYTETAPYPGIVPDTWTALPGGERVWYASRKGINRGTWKRLLNEQEWDAIYINGVWSPWFSAMPPWLTRGSATRRIVAVRGMLASGMMKHGTLKKRLFLAAMKFFGCYRGVAFQATNAEEVRDVKRWISPTAVVHLVPNLGRRARGALPVRTKHPGELKLVSLARIAVEKNTLFAIECLNGLAGAITFDLYGPVYDEAFWRKCQEAIAALPPNVKVVYKGAVPPEEVPALLTGYHALFMPSQGENFGHAMAEALASGLPLLISDRTPWRGLEQAGAGWDLALDDRPAFTGALNKLVAMDDAGFARMSIAARDFGAKHDGSTAVVDGMLRLFGLG